MMKRLLAILLLAAILCGCGPAHPPEQTVSPTQTWAPAASTEPSALPESVLLTHARPWRGDETLLELPVGQLKDNPYCSSADILGDRLVLGSALYEPSEDTQFCEGEECTDELVGFRFTSVDLMTGETVAIRELDGVGYVQPQRLNGNLALCDNFGGSICLLDPDLNLLEQWEREPDECSWYLGRRSGRSVLYRFGYEQDCTAEDLETGETESILFRNPNLWAMDQSETALFVPIVTPPDWMQTMAELDLNTGDIVPIPGEIPAGEGIRVGGRWFCWSYGHGGQTCTIVDGDRVRTTLRKDDTLQMLPDGRFLLTGDDSLQLCDAEGRLLDMCRPQMAGETLWTWNIRRSDLLGGYVLRLDDGEGNQHLLLWQTGDEPGEQILHFEDSDGPEPPPRGNAVSQSLYERAEQIGRQYGIEVLIADQYQVPGISYTVEQMTDEAQITQGLDLLEEVLASYPEGFFRQLRWRNIRKLQIYLTGYIYPGDTYTIGGGYSAFAHEQGSACMVVMDVHSAAPHVYAHEFSHLIDRKLQWDAACRADSDYSEEAWMALNPEGFEYTYDYENVDSYFDDRSLYGWFLSPYSTVNPTEDRATVLEAAVGIDWAFWDAPGMQAKLRYYCDCIRDCFDTGTWPEMTVWEAALCG